MKFLGCVLQTSSYPKEVCCKEGDNVLNFSNEGEQLFYYNCFDNLKTKAFLSNILRGFITDLPLAVKRMINPCTPWTRALQSHGWQRKVVILLSLFLGV